MFKSNRYLIIASLIGIVSVVCLMILYRQIALTSMVDHETRSNEAITDLLSKAVRPAYLELIARGAAVESPDGEPAIARLHDEIEHLTRKSRLLKVKIYNLEGTTIFSSDASQIGEDKSDNEGFLCALEGHTMSNITFRDEFDAFDKTFSNVNVVSSYIGIYADSTAKDGGKLEAVFEVYSDVTDLYRQMQHTQWLIVIGVLGSTAIFYLLLLTNARRLDRIEAARLEEAQRNEAQMRFQASHDALTGLHNRHEFERGAERLIETAVQESGEHALCFMDLDQFKVVNDTCGHIAGDELLRQLSVVLQDAVRTNDTLARLGGDEFGILMEHCSLRQAHRTATQIQRNIQEFQFSWEGETFQIGVSIGLVAIDQTTASVTELLKHADAACYIAKDMGRNQIQVYNPDDTILERRHGEMQWVARINQALEKNRFTLYAQAIEPLGNSVDMHYELLLRMIDEDGEVIPPIKFLPAAERYDLMHKLDVWVVERALSLMAANPDFINQINFISINLSGQSLTHSKFLNSVITRIEQLDFEPEKLCFEITETAAISNLRAATDFINRLKNLGCHFALDDFGSGLSSFGYLKNLPVDYLKIDGVFVKDVAEDPIDHAMVKSINDIGHVMGMKTIAEFVENDAIRGILRDLSVDYAQGYEIGKPMPFEDVLELEETRNRLDLASGD
ncbi:MAG TPA: EAL domain-containing protein [Gammaproteobacteria bacterium]|nr:EAL domain-containing protein [Gammaproteobacteria bacterium]